MLSRSELKREAKESLSGNWGVAIGIIIVAAIITGALCGTGFGSLLVGVIQFGIASSFLVLVRTKTMSINNLFSGFSNFGTTVIAGILQMLFLALWSMLFVIPAIVKSYSYAMTYYIIQDHPNISANDAITESRRMMDGRKLELFVLDLSFIGWYILVGLTFGILSLYVTPYHTATRAAFYSQIKQQAPNA